VIFLPSYIWNSSVASHLKCHQFVLVFFLQRPRFTRIQYYADTKVTVMYVIYIAPYLYSATVGDQSDEKQ